MTYIDSNTLSYIFSIISIVFYTVLSFPQIYTIIKLKSSKGYAINSSIIWCTASIINLISIILLQLELTLLIIGWCHLFLSYLLLFTALYYSDFTRFKKIIITLFILLQFFLCLSIFIIGFFYNLLNRDVFVFATTLAWISVFIYIIGRLPQIYKNYKSKSTHGLSSSMFILIILGNVFYISSIIVISTSPAYIIKNLPWIILICGCTLFDLIILLQCIIYNKK